jgi:hypothetical protein
MKTEMVCFTTAVIVVRILQIQVPKVAKTWTNHHVKQLYMKTTVVTAYVQIKHFIKSSNVQPIIQLKSYTNKLA